MTQTKGRANIPAFLLGLMLLATTSCVTPTSATAVPPSTAPGPSTSAPLVLKAVLFPYIPDSAGDKYQRLIQRLESDFESTVSGVDLQITINPDMDLYDYSPTGTLSQLLGSGPDAAQVVEVDTILLGNLKHNQWVQPVGIENPGALPTAWQATTLEGVTYGVPTYLCTNVIYAERSIGPTPPNGTNLINALAGLKPGVTPLVGNYAGSWTLPSLYVDAWADTQGAAGMASAYQPPIDPKTMSFFSTVVNACASNASTNPCLDGTYKDNDKAMVAYASGAANGFIGYTEQLFNIRKANPQRPLPSVTSAPLGGGSNPSMFVDALVFNPHCTGACLDAARSFARYMSSTAVRNLIAFSQEGPPGTLPRYLLQANEAFYTSEPAASDPMYKAYLPIIKNAHPFPNSGFPDNRRALNQAIKDSLAPPAKALSTPPSSPSR